MNVSRTILKFNLVFGTEQPDLIETKSGSSVPCFSPSVLPFLTYFAAPSFLPFLHPVLQCVIYNGSMWLFPQPITKPTSLRHKLNNLRCATQIYPRPPRTPNLNANLLRPHHRCYRFRPRTVYSVLPSYTAPQPSTTTALLPPHYHFGDF